MAVSLFAFTTVLGWASYSERCLEYLIGRGKKNAILAYRWVYVAAVFIGPYLTVSAVWTSADIFNGLMAIPNCIALIALSGVVAKETKASDKQEAKETKETAKPSVKETEKQIVNKKKK